MLHRVIVWVILADFDQLFAVVVAAVGMWSTLLQRCPHVHGDAGVGKQGSQGLCLAYCLQGRQHAGQDFEPQIAFVAQAVAAALDHPDFVVEPLDEAERDLVLRPAVGGNGDTRIFLELEVRRIDCRRCGKVKSERLDFLADNPLYTKRFAYYVGRRCRDGTIKDVAAELGLDWHTVKALEMQYMETQLKRAGTPRPRAIGIDEISIRKGQTYRIVVSDLD